MPRQPTGPHPPSKVLPGLARGTAEYERRRRHSCWQAITPDRYPAAITAPAGPGEAGAAVAAARRSGHRVCVISSGHSYIGDGLQDDSLLLDLHALNTIELDLGSDTARIGTAVTNQQLDATLESVDRAFPVGHSPTVAVGGYLLGGGLGWNPDGWGVAACAQVIGATVVVASGEILRVSAREHPDLFWAVRGAGPCFPGLVLDFEVRLLPRPKAIIELSASYPFSDLASVARWACSTMPTKAPDIELAMMLVSPTQAAGPTIVVSATAFGQDAATVTRWLEPLARTLPNRSGPATSTLRPWTIAAMMAQNDAPPQRYSVEGVWSGQPLEAILRSGDRFRTCPSADSLVHISLRSCPTVLTGTAFSVARPAFVFSSAVWDYPEDDVSNHAWHDSLMDDLRSVTDGFYINELDYIRHPNRLRGCFTADNWSRLEQLQVRYDPQHVFHAPNRSS